MKRKFKVAGIGELLWDILPSGKQLGGAPFNFAYHAAQAGCEPYVISAIGKDEMGVEILEKINQLGIYSGYIQKNKYSTSTVTVKLDKNGHPEYTIHENVAWDYIHWNANLNVLTDELDAVCFGSLAQRNPESAGTIRTFLRALNPDCLKVFDINLRQHYFAKQSITESLQLADILKLNDDELPVLSRYYNLQGEKKFQLKILIEKFDLKYIIYTLGSEGSIIISSDDYSFMKAPKVKVCDTVGAGDAYTATFIAGLLQKKPLAELHKKATDVAAFVCTQKGAITNLQILK
ncbi:MAG: carbohydrate kinase [Prolixibacteraceae bacterium]|jgi:fructokinase|nr:carbohydrate kinase [Prolixibacteraceae bacterium]